MHIARRCVDISTSNGSYSGQLKDDKGFGRKNSWNADKTVYSPYMEVHNMRESIHYCAETVTQLCSWEIRADLTYSS